MKNKLNFSITIILFEPQLDENISAVARAMLNFNLYKKIFLKTTKAKKKQLFNFFNVLESYLEIKNFFNIKEKKQKKLKKKNYLFFLQFYKII